MRVDQVATFMYRPALPCCKGSPTSAQPLLVRLAMTWSATAPVIAMARAGPACVVGVSAATSPPASASALAPNR